MRFNVNDKVIMVAYNGNKDDAHFPEYIGRQGIIIEDDESIDQPYLVKFNNGKVLWLWQSDIELVSDTEELAPQTMTLKEAMKSCIDGAKVCFVGSCSPKNHMKFDGKNFVYFEDGEYEVVSMVLHQTQWKLWTEPETPPCFKPRQLIRNATGDIGFVVSDEGVKKGVRRYKVKFSAIEGSPLKNYDESMLYEVVL